MEMEETKQVLALLERVVAKTEKAYNAVPKRSSEEFRNLSESLGPEKYWDLYLQEKKTTDAYFNALQMQGWATAHLYFLETGQVNMSNELSSTGKAILKNYIQQVEVDCE